jgi:hypothetical protein
MTYALYYDMILYDFNLFYKYAIMINDLYHI